MILSAAEGCPDLGEFLQTLPWSVSLCHHPCPCVLCPASYLWTDGGFPLGSSSFSLPQREGSYQKAGAGQRTKGPKSSSGVPDS